jgi:hypothetical protein
MARQAQDREDLLRDAKALLPRLMLKLNILGEPCELFVGFRDNSLSLYFDADPVYQFNSSRELRRAFVDNTIIKAVAGELHTWQPERTEEEVAMNSRAMNSAESKEFVANLLRRLTDLRVTLLQRHFEIVGQVPAEGEGLARLQSWLDSVRTIEIAQAANVG